MRTPKCGPASSPSSLDPAAETLTWDTPADGGTGILGYEITVFRGPSRERIGWREVGHLPQATVDGLDNSASYSFTVQAVNAAGWSPVSTASNPVIPGTSVPAAPGNVKAVAGNNSATVSWSAPDNGGSPITKYVVRAYQSGTSTVVITREVLGNATSVQLVGVDRPLLVNGTSYTFTVQAVNANGSGPESSPSSPVTPAATVPSAPADVHADAADGGVHLT